VRANANPVSSKIVDAGGEAFDVQHDSGKGGRDPATVALEVSKDETLLARPLRRLE